jgi:RHS repeat-associated protein
VITGDLSTYRITSVQDELSRTTNYQYDYSGRPTRITLPEGNYTAYTYDARGNVTETRNVAKSGSGLSDIVATASYPSSCSNTLTCNKPSSTTDARGHTTDYTYDSTHGGILTVTRPPPSTSAVRPQVRYSYSSLSTYPSGSAYMLTGTSQCQTGSSCAGTGDEAKTSIAYNAALQPTSISKGDGTGALTATTAMTYDVAGNVTYVDGPLAGTADTTRYLYNANREMVGAIEPDPDGAGSMQNRATRVTYGSTGLVTKKELGTTNGQSDSAWTGFTAAQAVDIGYDSNRRPVTSKLSSGSNDYALTQTGYDALGRTDCTATRMNPATYGSLPSSACSLGTAGSHGDDRVSQIVYDNASQPTVLREAVGTSDQADERSLAYTNNGLVSVLRDGENNGTSYVYDGFDRLVETAFPVTTKGAATTNWSDYELLGYDANSNVTSFRNRAGNSFAFTYDNLDRGTFKDRPGSEPDVTYAYDNLGRMTSASQSGTSLAFTYDALSRQTGETGQITSISQQFDLAGRRIEFSTGHGFWLKSPRLVTGEMKNITDGNNNTLATYTYDDLRRRTGLTFFGGQSTSWSYDSVSRLSGLSHDFSGTSYDLTKSFSYNPASQIVSETRSNDSYAFTANSNINQATVTNGLNELSTVGGTSASNDANGNLTSDPATAKTYAYDSENKLTSASGGVTLNYDPLDRLQSIVTSSATRKFLYAPGDSRLPEMLSEYDGSNNIIAHYGYGPSPDEPVLWLDATIPVWRALHADERGSIVALSYGNATVTGVNRYDENGLPQSGNAGRFQYTGQMWLPEASVYHYKARAFEPHLGRFLQPDPIGYAESANLYPYVGNDPINATDATGMANCPPDCSPITITANQEQNPGTSGNSLSVIGGSSRSTSNLRASNIEPNIVVTANPRPSPGAPIVITGRRNRPLSAAEVALYRSFGYPEKVLMGVTLHLGIPWYVPGKNTDGFTRSATDIYLDNLSSALSSAGQAGLIGHELYHAWEFYTGALTALKYLGSELGNGYGNDPYEERARQWQRYVISGYCQRVAC